jgi:hypothetical protein
MTTIEQSFGVKLSIEPLPEQCSGAVDPGVSIGPFTINAGEGFGEVIARLEEASQGRWIFEEIHGVPLLRPDNSMAGHGTLLDTVVTADFNAPSMWEALCALARAANSANNVHNGGARPMIIQFFAPGLLRHPPPEFVEKKQISVSLDHASAREGLCTIIAQVEAKFWITYSYNCVAEGRKPDYDYISIDAYDSEGKVVNGGRMSGEDYERLTKTVDWMSDENMLAVQAPVPDDSAQPKK